MASSPNKVENLDKNFLWIHCFKCYDFYGFKTKDFFVLQCTHISCVKCLVKVDDSRVVCPCCKKPSGYCLIHNEMPASVKKYFHPRPYENKMSIDWKVVNFQMRCHKNLVNRLLLLKRINTQTEFIYYKNAVNAKRQYEKYKAAQKTYMYYEKLARKVRTHVMQELSKSKVVQTRSSSSGCQSLCTSEGHSDL